MSDIALRLRTGDAVSFAAANRFGKPAVSRVRSEIPRAYCRILMAIMPDIEVSAPPTPLPTHAENRTEVFAVHGADPEVLAYAMAKYSRSALSMKESLCEISSQKAEQFLNTFYFQYGDRKSVV